MLQTTNIQKTLTNQMLLLYLSILLISYVITKRILRKYQNLPPTPFPTLPILGHLYLLKDPNSIHRTLLKLSEKYGPIVSLQFGLRPTLLVSSPSATEDCLNHNDVLFSNRPRLIAGKSLGYDYTSILWAPYGPLWRNHRRIASTEILSPHRLQTLASIRADEVRLSVRRVSLAAGNGDKIVEMKPMLFELTYNIMMRMIAGKRFFGEETDTKEAKSFQEMVKEMQNLGSPSSAVDLFPFLSYIGFGRDKFKAVADKWDKFFQGLVDEHRSEMQGERTNNSSGQGEKIKSMIEVLLELQKTDPDYFTDDIIKGLIQVLVLAGTETTASTIEWALSVLVNNPDIQKKLYHEIEEHVGHDRLMTEADLSRLSYLHCVINETLRMYPATPILPPRECSADCVVGGYHVPKGTMLSVNVWAMQNDPKDWPEPMSFKPERFEGAKDHKNEFKFMPFGAGRRACPGENLGLKVVGLVLGTLIQCFSLERAGDQLVDMEELVGVTMWKAHPLQVKCIPRESMMKFMT